MWRPTCSDALALMVRVGGIKVRVRVRVRVSVNDGAFLYTTTEDIQFFEQALFPLLVCDLFKSTAQPENHMRQLETRS